MIHPLRERPQCPLPNLLPCWCAASWMPPVAGPFRAHAPLFATLELDEKTGRVSVEFTLEGLACFRGWLRRQGLDPVLGTS
jgi:hypothetical protein